MYESGTRIVCSTAAPAPDKLFREDPDEHDDDDDDTATVAVFEHDNGAPLADPAAQATECVRCSSLFFEDLLLICPHTRVRK